MEVSSHALEQKRVTGSIFDIAVFTNLSRDHLDYHGTMADYAAAKRQLFTHNEKQVAVLNGDEKQTQGWLKNWPSLNNLWVYGRSELVRQQPKFVSCGEVKHHNQGVDFTLKTHLGDIDIQSALLGDFNIDNLLAVIAVLLIEEISLGTIAEKVSRVKAISGRMEAFSAQGAPTAGVDYAHTPDALEKALIACRQHCHGELYVVFGCGGDRDKGKRPLMAQVAQQYADKMIVTNDNPRTESPENIIEDVLAGLTDKMKANVIVDRKKAVQHTLENAQSNDVVLLAGKGHENYIILGQNKIDYNERQIVKNFFDKFEEQSLSGERI
jgi:UDP-N-acetylmuramoyl-L-alanyl-D-glutamate--2,6-diaminopimelate ligase